MNRVVFLGLSLLLLLLSSTANAQVPQAINYQGRVVVGTTNFDGAGQFKFALVNTNGTTTFWSNNGTSSGGSEPSQAVSLTVTKGLYSVLLGDTSLTNMTAAVPPSVFTNSDVRLRVWFNDGTHGSQVLSPDQRISSVGYAMVAAGVPDGAITSAKIASGAVTGTQLANGGVGTNQIADNSVTGDKIPTHWVVKSINGLTDILTLAAGPNISITPSGNTLTLSSTGGGSSFWQYNNGSVYYNGPVGIGMDTPTAELEISNVNGNNLRLDGAIPHINFIDTSNSSAVTSIGANNGGFYVGNNFLLTSSGSLGLGTNSPGSRLHISGTPAALRLTALHPYITLDDTAAAGPSHIEANVGGMDFKSNGAVSGSNPGGLIHLDTLGTVGIGTATPSHQLTIVSNSGTPGWTSNGWLGEVALDNSAAIAWGSNSAGNRFGIGHTNGGFLMFHTTANPGTTGSAAIYDFTIDDSSRVGIGTNAPVNKLDVRGGSITTDSSLGIGTTNPAAALHVNSAGGINTPQALLNQTTSGDYARLRFTSPSNPAWDIAVGSSSNVMNFYAGSTAKNVLTLNTNGTVSVPILSITGGSDVAEPFRMGDQEIEKGSVVVIDEAHPGLLKRSTHAYDKRVAGIVSGANGVNPGIALHQDGALDGGQNVALSGRVYVQAVASNGPIEPGDMLTTSDIPGYAMKVTEPTRAQGAVIGKAMSPLPKDSGPVLVLVTLQ